MEGYNIKIPRFNVEKGEKNAALENKTKEEQISSSRASGSKNPRSVGVGGGVN